MNEIATVGELKKYIFNLPADMPVLNKFDERDAQFYHPWPEVRNIWEEKIFHNNKTYSEFWLGSGCSGDDYNVKALIL